MGESPAAAGRGAEGRIHGGERGRSEATTAAADTETEAVKGPKKLQTEPNVLSVCSLAPPAYGAFIGGSEKTRFHVLNMN